MKKWLLLLSALLCLPALAAPLPVAASFSILGDLVQNVGGERIQLVTLVGPEQDAHIFQPTPADVQKLGGTRLFFINGLGFEGWQKRLQQASNYRGKVITVTQGISPLAMKDEQHGHSLDPHAWQDPVRVQQMVKNIAEALSTADPAGAADYQARAASYSKKIDQLMAWAQQEVASVPPGKRVVLTSHDAFAYLGQRFGIRLISPQGVSTESEASAKDVARLIRQMKKEGIRALFMENISNPKLIEQIARETGTQPGAKLYSDALSRDAATGNYLGMYRHNIGALVAGMKENK
ncbi:MAG: metal transporter substrate-binding protein [Proteobacteria bacterium]|nr:metal transporter substrate-binding protein [Pseudomonadota bacterium]